MPYRYGAPLLTNSNKFTNALVIFKAKENYEFHIRLLVSFILLIVFLNL